MYLASITQFHFKSIGEGLQKDEAFFNATGDRPKFYPGNGQKTVLMIQDCCFKFYVQLRLNDYANVTARLHVWQTYNPSGSTSRAARTTSRRGVTHI